MNLDFLYTAVSWVLLRWHNLFSLFIDKDSGLNWSLSIVFLVVTARILLFRVFLKQVNYQRHMQEMQPKIQALRKKHKDDKAEMQRQMMKLQQEQGFNPLSGCLPMFLQIPIFIGLYHVLRHLSNSVTRCDAGSTDHVLKLYTFSGGPSGETCSAAKAQLFHAPLAARLTDSPHQVVDLLGGHLTPTRIVIVALVLISSAATYLTQRLVRSGATTVPEGTAATVQKLMLYLIPVMTLGSGLFFPLGVLLYWFTSNSWTMGQQFYINKFHPHPDLDKTPPVVGELGRTLAPKPGQRPNTKAKPATLVKTANTEETPTVPPARNAPRPGQRPVRSGNRPPAKRPSQAKKRR
ncbi:MAG: membrane protein insertase YidC [Pseudonocardiales bacterium]|nr:MAG: membrane protein insertase YidC [Pseudonocardiales bacterium]